MRKTVFGMAAAVVFFAVLAALRGGWSTLVQGLLLGATTAVQIAPLLVAAFAVAGLISVLISEEQVARWLGRESGFKGILLAALAGALVPGGPYVYFPLAATFLVAGAEIGTVVAFVTAKNLWTLSRLPLEMALLTPEITAIRYVVTFVFPPLLGLWANFLFAKQTPPIRRGIHALQQAAEKKEDP
ncbi:MAG: permease [Desulfohalobium sp.]